MAAATSPPPVPLGRRRTKIVATLGPMTDAPEAVLALARAGMDVARINGSHGSHDTHRAAIRAVRAAADTLGRPLGVLFDLQGPKIRLGKFEGVRRIAAGQSLALAVRRAPEGDELPCDYDHLDDDVHVGAALLINDGAVRFEVTEVSRGRVVARALGDGELSARKGINLPDCHISAPALTPKDEVDAAFALGEGVDMLALSFVRDAQDVRRLQQLVAERGAVTPIIAKIEKPEGLENIEAIVDAAFGVMVARGDLGVELSVADVPMAQKRIIAAANRRGRIVITATQMLESMCRAPTPTRAEASDVANAVLDGTDAVMLSQETATGSFPNEAVATMERIILATEQHPLARRAPSDERRAPSVPEAPTTYSAGVPAAVARAGCEVARELGARALIVFTESGRMAHLVSQQRPPLPVLAFAADASLRQRLNVVWGVTPLLGGPSPTMEERMRELDETLLRLGAAKAGERIVLLVGGPSAPSGSTNLLLVHHVAQKQPLPALLATSTPQ